MKNFLATVSGPIVLVGHSYGGSVITNAAEGNPNVKALVYVDAAAPDVGETNGSLSGADSVLKQKPENELFDKLPYPGAPAGAVDLYLKKDIFLQNFGNDLPADVATQLWATQRSASTECVRNAVEVRGVEDDPVLVLHQQRRPDHHAHLGEGDGRAGPLTRHHLRRRLAPDADLAPRRGDRRHPASHRLRALTRP